MIFFLKRFYLFSSRGRGREGEGERERNIGVRKKHQLVASHMHPYWGPNMQPTYVHSAGIEPAIFRFVANQQMTANQLSHTGQGRGDYF